MELNLWDDIKKNISKVFIGKAKTIELLLVGLLAEGHVLLEDVPGVGKTLLAKALATTIGGDFKRIQFTPDLLPSDITGFNMFDQKSGGFILQQGPVMTNVLLADEINRTIPRTQASLLESMEERQVTIDGATYKLPQPFFVIATQNPIETEGTFPLPEAQLDRFLLKIDLGYPSKEEEVLILERFQGGNPLEQLTAVISPEQLLRVQEARRQIVVAPSIKEYIVNITQATRNSQSLRFGVSPRGALSLMRSAQALAMVRNRSFVLPDDIKELAHPVLEHRIILQNEERMRGKVANRVLSEIISQIPVPIMEDQ